METEDEAGYSRPQSQYEGYVGVTDYTDSMPSHSERRVSMDESEYSRPCSQAEGYVGITDYTD